MALFLCSTRASRDGRPRAGVSIVSELAHASTGSSYR
jgi:hypothetical protein